MKFSMMSWPAAAKCVTGAVLLGALLSACGGGDQVEEFRATRVVAFGDEASVLVPTAALPASAPVGATNAVKYTVNSATTAGVFECALHPLWIQHVASAFGLAFEECNPLGIATTSESNAVAGARVADVVTQIDAFMAADSFTSKTLVTVMAGQHDVLAQYALVTAAASTVSEADALAAVDAAGAALARQVNRIAEAGGKVLITTIPNVGQTPFGVAQQTATGGRPGLLSRLTASFNARLRVSLTNDGRKIGLMLADETIDAVIRTGSFTNATTAACTSATLLTCTTATLAVVGAADSYLWADTLWLTPAGQRLLGSLAVTRATGNPF